MKIKKFTTQTATDGLITASGAVTGVMTGNIAFEKLPVLKEKSKIKRGLLVVLGVGLATMIDTKDEAGKFVQGVGVGMASHQGVALLKEIINPDSPAEGEKPSIIYTAVGGMNAPEDTVYVIDNTYAPPAIEAGHYNGNDPVNFLAGAVMQENFADMMM